MVSPRWNPTPEQLHALNDMYQRGTKTPSAQQIQLIAAKLRRFGRIEGKNVFYWFQNHKARDRQRQRLLRHSSLAMALGNDHNKPKPMMHHCTLSSVAKETPAATGLGKMPFEVGQTEIWASLSNSSTLSEESLLIQQGAVVSQCKTETRDLTQHLEEEITRREAQTLPLFPTSRDDYNTIYKARSGAELPHESGIMTHAPPKIFEFFP